MIIVANVPLEQQIITGETFTALRLMAVGGTMLTTPVVASKRARMKALVARSR
jgi:hypothetical protein